MAINVKSETKIIIGGILAKYEYDLRSQTDVHFTNSIGVNLLATEVKTRQTLVEGDMWYRNSRGVQSLSALYAFNSPVFFFYYWD